MVILEKFEICAGLSFEYKGKELQLAGYRYFPVLLFAGVENYHFFKTHLKVENELAKFVKDKQMKLGLCLDLKGN